MTKVQDIDIAFAETLKKHPDFIPNISQILYKNATSRIEPTNFTNTNMARTRVLRLDCRDFIEYIVRNAVIIYSAYNKLIYNSPRHINNEWANASSFYDIGEIQNAVETIITNRNINSILYYTSNPNALFALANAVAKTRFNPNWYNNGYSYTPDPLNKGEDFRRQIDSIGLSAGSEMLTKIDHDVEIIKPMAKVNVNYEAMNRCLREVVAGSQVKYNRSEYALDGTLYATQDVGRKRKNQEDSVIILTHPDNDQFKFIAVADGVGGLDGGEKASNMVVKGLAEWFKSVPADAYYLPSGLKESLDNAIRKINSDITSKFPPRNGRVSVGSTLVGAIVTENDTIIANIGDSRAYTVSPYGVSLVTTDESKVWAEFMYEHGGRRPTAAEIDDLRFNPESNFITKCLGNSNLGTIQMTTIPNSCYNTLLLLSDGVSDLLSHEDIRVIAQNTPRDEITRALVDKALNNNAVKQARFTGDRVIPAGKDNATAAMYRR